MNTNMYADAGSKIDDVAGGVNGAGVMPHRQAHVFLRQDLVDP